MIRYSHRIAIIALLAFPPVDLGAEVVREEASADPFATCEVAFAAQRGDGASSYCYYQTALRERNFEAGIERLEVLLAKDLENPWLHLTLGYLHWPQDLKQAEAAYNVAAAKFHRKDDAIGEALAREGLCNLLFQQGRAEDAEIQLEHLLNLADTSQLPEVEARALIVRAKRLHRLGFDRENVYRLLRQAEEKIFPEGPYPLQRGCLIRLGAVTYELGRYNEALTYYRRIESLATDSEDAYGTASFRYNLANTRLAEMGEVPKPGGREELITLFHQALEAAQIANHRSVKVQSHRLLGNLLSASAENQEQAVQHFNQCLDGARQLGKARLEAACLRALGSHRIRWHSPTAQTVLNEAETLARQKEDLWALVQIEEQRMRSLWDTAPPSRAMDDSLAALETIEDLRAQQQAESGRANIFALLTDPYYWLAGRLLKEDPPSRQNREQAFQLAEQLRSRVLLEALDTSSAAMATPKQGELAQARKDLVDVQRQLLAPDLDEAARQHLLLDLEKLEWAEAEALTTHLDAAAPDFATLEEIEATLAEGEALLTFQVALWKDIYNDFAGGAWLFVVTHEGSQVHRLPDRTRLRPAVRIFRGLLERRDGSEGTAAATLYHDLLAPALDALPPGIERLIIVPDDDLHLLPWGALAESAEAPTLAERFHISLAPSATLWKRFREQTTPIQGAVLTFADPQQVGASTNAEATERTWALATGARLGALPHARREGRAAVRSLGGSSQLLLGAEATEHTLKTADLSAYGLMHFAAHAVVDERYSQRSAVLLAPGDPSEDGLLQPRDIVELDLTGKAVVLSACQSATGEVLRGEGVLSLARPFFQAGANAVVGSLWPLRDDEAAQLFEAFYRHLARGKSLEAALAAAQADLIAEGAPAAAWSGLAVLGDGSLVPVPGGRSRLGLWSYGLLGLLLLFMVVARVWRRV